MARPMKRAGRRHPEKKPAAAGGEVQALITEAPEGQRCNSLPETDHWRRRGQKREK